MSGLVLNILAYGLPIIVSMAAIPILLARLGVARFGVLNIFFVIITFAGLVDFGIGRACNRQLAQGALSREAGIKMLLRGGVLVAAGGILAGVLLSGFAYELTYKMLKMSGPIASETMHASVYLALILPLVTLGSFFEAGLAGLGRFGELALARFLAGILTFGGPLAGSYFGPPLTEGVISLAIGRLIILVWMGRSIRAGLRAFPSDATVKPPTLKALLAFGGWTWISSMATPILLYVDRFVIGSAAGVTAVAAYSIPASTVTKLSIVPTAIGSVMFPQFSRVFSEHSAKARELYQTTLYGIYFMLAPPLLVAVLFAPDLIKFWLGHSHAGQAIAEQSGKILRILAPGVLVNALGQVTLTVLQAAGRPQWPAKIVVLELVPYLLIAFFLTEHFGAVGMALTWTTRTIIETSIFVVLGHSSVALDRKQQIRFLLLIVVSGLAFYVSAQAQTPVQKFSILFAGTIVYLAALLDTVRTTYPQILRKVRWPKLASFG